MPLVRKGTRIYAVGRMRHMRTGGSGRIISGQGFIYRFQVRQTAFQRDRRVVVGGIKYAEKAIKTNGNGDIGR